MFTSQPALSASRAKEYLQCPLKFRFSVVDRIPQPPTQATIRGTLVHAVLEALFELPAPRRTPQAAASLLEPKWQQLSEKHADYAPVIAAAGGDRALLEESTTLLGEYFALEVPTQISSAATEQRIEVRLPTGLNLRGIVDRVDRAPDGRLRVIDYKTGKAPSPRFVEEALFQMRFYALMLREADTLPTRMQLLYLKSRSVLTLDPSGPDIDVFQDELMGLWRRISADLSSTRFQPKRGPLCNWCAYQAKCPLFGGAEPVPAAQPKDLARVSGMCQSV